MIPILISIFVVGYAAIIFEHKLNINKAGVALCTGIFCWTALIMTSQEPHAIVDYINEEISGIASILLFLVGAMTIVEVMDAHDAFRFITDKIRTRRKRKLLWIIALITFFLSALLDNLTTTIVMVLLIRKLIDSRRDRLLFVSMIIIAANAGGAWTPMGDVTTTMLWIGGQISTSAIICNLFVPSLVCILVPLTALSFMIKGNIAPVKAPPLRRSLPARVRATVFLLGVSLLVFVPIFKTITHLPPFTGMMLGVGVLWIFTGIAYRKYSLVGNRLSVTHALQRIDMSTILFFLGILLSVGSLQKGGLLDIAANWLNSVVQSQAVIVALIGMISSVIDNVPLVAAAQGMYHFPTDHFFWEFLAYAAGTGGSMLVIGSAAGVAAMGLENINFIWYFKNISWLALIGYLAGAGVYLLQHMLFATM
jgi:Na+/H+ antiporter NhaD/arsenite permease-like protein